MMAGLFIKGNNLGNFIISFHQSRLNYFICKIFVHGFRSQIALFGGISNPQNSWARDIQFSPSPKVMFLSLLGLSFSLLFPLHWEGIIDVPRSGMWMSQLSIWCLGEHYFDYGSVCCPAHRTALRRKAKIGFHAWFMSIQFTQRFANRPKQFHC